MRLIAVITGAPEVGETLRHLVKIGRAPPHKRATLPHELGSRALN